MDPNFAVAHYDLGQALVQKYMYSEAIAELETATTLSADSPICKSTLAYAYAVSGRRNEALKTLNDLTRQSKDFSSAADIALIYTGLGGNDRATAWLEKAYSKRCNPSILLRPAFDPLRSDPHFQDLLHRFGLPVQIWKPEVFPRPTGGLQT